VEFAEQTNGQIIDTKKTTVFQSSKEGALSRAAQACDDDEREWLHRGDPKGWNKPRITRILNP